MEGAKVLMANRLSEDPQGADEALISYTELSKHNKPGDCWIVVNKKVYDVSAFAPEHPGGAGVIFSSAGSDCTDEFLAAHPEDIMRLTLGRDGLAKAYIGKIDSSTMPLQHEASKQKAEEVDAPPLAAVLNLHDMEAIAQR